MGGETNPWFSLPSVFHNILINKKNDITHFMKNKDKKNAGPGGRPPKYSKEILDKTREYIDLCTDGYEVIERPKIENGIDKGTELFRKEKIKIPTIEGLAFFLKIHKDTIYEWRKEVDKKEFSELIEDLLAKQADQLINKGLSGDYSPVIAKVLLTKHGYADKIETDVTSQGEKILTGIEINVRK